MDQSHSLSPAHVYLEVGPVDFNRTYLAIKLYKTAALFAYIVPHVLRFRTPIAVFTAEKVLG